MSGIGPQHPVLPCSHTRRRPVLAALVAALMAWPPAQAQTVSAASPSLYLQYGAAEHGADSWAIGATVPWRDWRRSLWGGEITGYWDLWAGRWSARLDNRRRGTALIGINPTLRWRGDAGRSPWLMEAGLGLSWALNRRYATEHKEFATRYNFATHIGLGYLFGASQQHELVLRLEHHSNAGIKKPNPGENFLQLRYAHHF